MAQRAGVDIDNINIIDCAGKKTLWRRSNGTNSLDEALLARNSNGKSVALFATLIYRLWRDWNCKGQQWGTSFGLGWQSFLGGLVCYGGVVLTEFSKSELHMVRKLKRVAHIILDFNSKEY
ncbi:hypothetical protein HPP92_016371 [Vanilla planifolia]|uniref:Uncharacterized protein n=1 Tax=Vanilla planifolia TaxID=51239 RepID=A0A835QAT1_VANPL|nr:hypothetical protein HPP92_016371 [Vanilla planifolia]